MPNLINTPPDTETDEDVETVECADCGDTLTVGEDEITERHSYGSPGGWATRPYCSSHFTECPSCGDTHYHDDMITLADTDEQWCGGCVTTCDDCGECVSSTNYDGYCSECRDGGLMGYGRTRPTTWLGGPLPKREDGSQIGYYLGIELEISAEYNDRSGYSMVRSWLDDHMGGRENMDLKHDGSVEGYELATQPMTPEFFENVNWESFFRMINDAHPISDDEPDAHGLHVHIGRTAFHRDDVAIAAFCYLINQGGHLERIGRREATHYCEKVHKPVSSAIVHRKGTRTTQGMRLHYNGTHVGRNAINLTSDATIEIRAFKSTRSANDLRDAVRMVYVAAEYIRDLRVGRKPCGPQALHWDTFAEWVKTNYPFAYPSIAGHQQKGSNRRP